MLSKIVSVDIKNDSNKILKMGLGLPKRIIENIKSYFRSLFLAWFIGFFTFLTVLKEILLPWCRILFAKRHPVFVRTPEERFNSIWKLGYRFQSKYLELPLGSGAKDKLPR